MSELLKNKTGHESYGMIQICKISSNDSQLTISRAEQSREVSSDFYFSREEIIRVEMSHNQFVDAITSGMNTNGVPCTIKHVNCVRIPQIEHATDKKEIFVEEMKKTQEKYIDLLESIDSKISNMKIGVSNKKELQKDLSVLSSWINGNSNFVLKQFQEEMEKVVVDAKHSISNYVDNKIHTMGLEAMRDELNISLPETKK